MTDEKIIQQILEQLDWDSRIDADNINVAVSDRRVRLSGSVSTYLAKQAAQHAALYVPGVRAVENDIRLKYGEGAPETDARLAAILKQRLEWHPDLQGTSVNVTVSDGIVALEGTVEFYWQQERATDLATKVQGVREVENRLTVVPTQKVSDEQLARDVGEALRRNVAVDSDEISVKVADAVVTLSGHVPDWRVKTATFFSAHNTNGVRRVEDQLEVD